MPEFAYTARQSSGEQVTGLIDAQSQHDALSALASRQLFPIKVDLAESARAQQKYVGRRVRPKHLSIFYSQLADLLKSGVPLLRSLELLERQARVPALKLVLEDIKNDVADGGRLYDAMRKHPKAFNELVISMIRAGEEGSFLEDVLKRVAIFTDHQEALKGRVVGAMIYPTFLLCFGTIVVTAMLVWFVPQFESMFTRLESTGQLPWATTALIAFSDIAQSYWWAVLLIVGGIAVGLHQASQTDNGRLQLDQFRLKCFGVGRIVRSLAISRFCRVLGTLINNGVPILQSLRISKDATGNLVLAGSISRAADSISAGKSLAEPLRSSGEFPDEVVEMIAVGEEANNLENVLIDIADNLENRTNREMDIAVRMLEPIMLLLMALVVLFVVIALMLPIMRSSSSI